MCLVLLLSCHLPLNSWHWGFVHGFTLCAACVLFYVLTTCFGHMQPSSFCYQRAPYGSLQDGYTDGHSGDPQPAWLTHRPPVSSSPSQNGSTSQSHIRRISDLSISNENDLDANQPQPHICSGCVLFRLINIQSWLPFTHRRGYK